MAEPEFDHVPLVESYWSNTPERWHSERPFGVPGAFVTTNPPPSVRLIVMRWPKMPTVPPPLRYGLEFVTQPPDEQSTYEELLVQFKVPPFALMDPVMSELIPE